MKNIAQNTYSKKKGNKTFTNNIQKETRFLYFLRFIFLLFSLFFFFKKRKIIFGRIAKQMQNSISLFFTILIK